MDRQGVVERVGKEFQLGRNCSGCDPRRDERVSCRSDSLASG
jgi:hypothetical protein